MDNTKKASEHDNYYYLLNFWQPQLGDEVREQDNTDSRQIELLEADDTQVKLRGLDVNLFIQDLIWEPTVERTRQLVEKFGGRFNADSVQYRDVSFPLPDKVLDYADVIRNIRHYAMLKGFPDPAQQFGFQKK